MTPVRLAALVVAVGACGASPAPTSAPAPEQRPPPADNTAVSVTVPRQPIIAPRFAHLAGLLPRRTIGAEAFLARHPTYDGRGVVIAILDSGVDAGVPGLRRTTSDSPKLLDLRDFSGEGRIALTRIEPDTGDAIEVGTTMLTGLGRVRRLGGPPYFGGTFAERPLGQLPGADVNGDGDTDDVFPLVVARASDGWFVMTDSDADGSLEDEQAVRDYSVAHETLAYGPLTIAVNLADAGSAPPRLDLVFDTSGHGTHVAGIAAGHDLFGLDGFDGIAPGAQLLGLKISNNARGGISVSGSMVAAMEYAAEYAAARGLPLVLNLSFGVGNELEGSAAIDSVVDAFALRHPEVLFVIAAANDGPGVSTVGFPGSAEFALTTCALYPGVFARPPQPGQPPVDDVLGWWSSRGGEVLKPDLCAPGVAFSNVPPWQTGEEVSAGTSMAAPQLSGAAALLLSALQQLAQPVRAAELHRALVATAKPLPGASTLDVVAGVPDVSGALNWLRAAHRAGRFSVRALPDGGNTSRATAAYRRSGLASAADTTQRFAIRAVDGQPFAKVLLRSDAPWLRTPPDLEFRGEPVEVTLTYDASQLTAPGLHVGTVWARPATDTLAGAVFALSNTVIVPHALDREYSDRRYVAAGRLERYFFDVPADAGGLRVELTVVDEDQEATLYLFDPGSHPELEVHSVLAGGDQAPTAAIDLRAEDVQAGVYEVVVVAPPLERVHYGLSVSRPDVTLEHVDVRGIKIRNRSTSNVDVRVTADIIGATRRFRVAMDGDRPHRIPVRVPEWAHELVVDLDVPSTAWRRFTDFAVSVWDSSGHLASESPANYARSREFLEVDTLSGRRLEIELYPALVLPEDAFAWEGIVEIAFFADEPLATLRSDTLAPVPVASRGSTVVPVDPAAAVPPTPDGFTPIIEARLTGGGGPGSTRRAAVAGGIAGN